MFSVVKYDTKVTIHRDGSRAFHGYVYSEIRRCERNRRVILYELMESGQDYRRLGDARTSLRHGKGSGPCGSAKERFSRAIAWLPGWRASGAVCPTALGTCAAATSRGPWVRCNRVRGN